MTVTLEIISVTGEITLREHKQLPMGSTTITLPATSLSSGIYTLRISSDAGINLTKKLVKLN